MSQCTCFNVEAIQLLHSLILLRVFSDDYKYVQDLSHHNRIRFVTVIEHITLKMCIGLNLCELVSTRITLRYCIYSNILL